MRSLTSHLFLFFLLLCCASLQPAAQNHGLYFKSFTTANGLSNNRVNCILQDKRGFVWIGTDDGLNRFDGNIFKVFRNEPGNSATLSGNIIKDLLEDSDGVLWVATADGGLTRYDYRLPPDRQFRQFKHSALKPSIPVNTINAIEEDKNGMLWLATGGSGIIRFDKNHNRFSVISSVRKGTCIDITRDAKGTLWIGGEGGGIVKIDPATLEYTEDARYRNFYASLPHQSVTRFFKDDAHNIWMGSWDKALYKYNSATGREEVFKNRNLPGDFPDDDALCFAQDGKKNIWIGTKESGLAIYNTATQQFSKYSYDISKEGSLANNRVNSICIGPKGTVLIGTANGLSVYNPDIHQFTQTCLPNSVTQKTIYDFFEITRDEILIAATGGLYIFRPSNNSFSYHKLYYKRTAVTPTKFFKAADGTLFLGSDISLFKFNKNYALEILPGTEKDIVMRRIIDSRVNTMMADTIENRPALVVSPYGHFLAYYDFVLKQWVSRQDSVKKIIKNFNLKDNLIEKFFRDNRGRTWIATNKNGLGEWKNDVTPRITFYRNEPFDVQTISNNRVFDIQQKDDSSLWVSTYGGGLNIFNTNSRKFTHLNVTGNLLEGLQTDRKGNVWMLANGALHKYDPSKKTYISYDLPDAKKSGGVHGYIFKQSDGNMFIAGDNYFIKFHPDSITDILFQPKVYLTDIKIMDKPHSELLTQKNIRLSHDQNFLNFEFSSPVDYPGQPVQYAYKLEGVDANWVYPGNRNTANYTHLNDGEYVFKVKSTLKPGEWSSSYTWLPITILPPFWERWWFITLIIAALFSLSYGFYRYRINELLKRQAMRNKIAQDLHDNIGSTLGSISVYSGVAKIYQQQGREQSLTDTLEKINTASVDMISDMSDIVWAINPANDNMQNILQRMESFAKPLLLAQHISFHFNFDERVKNVHPGMSKRKNFYLIFKEAINNAVKYAHCKNVWVDITFHPHSICMAIKDDGAGFNYNVTDEKNLSGNGLRNMKLRAAEMKGHFVIKSQPGKGTLLTLEIPIP